MHGERLSGPHRDEDDEGRREFGLAGRDELPHVFARRLTTRRLSGREAPHASCSERGRQCGCEPGPLQPQVRRRRVDHGSRTPMLTPIINATNALTTYARIPRGSDKTVVSKGRETVLPSANHSRSTAKVASIGIAKKKAPPIPGTLGDVSLASK